MSGLRRPRREPPGVASLHERVDESELREANAGTLHGATAPYAPASAQVSQLPQRNREHRGVDGCGGSQLSQQLRGALDTAPVAILPGGDQTVRGGDVAAAHNYLAGNRSLQTGQVIEHCAFGKHLPVRLTR